jgi:hypothetical protein
MNKIPQHSFHIPVMGLGYTIDTPIKVAKYGIASVISIMEDHLIEKMRGVYAKENELEYIPISDKSPDKRAKRITAYLNLVDQIVQQQFQKLKDQSFKTGLEIQKYFQLLPDDSLLKQMYLKMMQTKEPKIQETLAKEIKNSMQRGGIDVNIMTKLDRPNRLKVGTVLPQEFADAHAALRGFALSSVEGAVIFSAGMNPRLYSYCENFEDFFPNEKGFIKKRIILKVSDFRSALIQGKMFAKKGIWVSEYRIESGLNCGGHAFATDGLLLGPILEEFKAEKDKLLTETLNLCNQTLASKNKTCLSPSTKIHLSAQGGLGTSEEAKMLINNYDLDSTGWGSPFLLVPEATTVENDTLQKLATAKPENYYLSNASPLGVPFSNFDLSTSEVQRKARIEKGRPGSPCYKKYLAFDKEFSEDTLCVSSRAYQKLKLDQLETLDLSQEEKDKRAAKIIEKDCLCEGLGTGALLNHKAELSHKLTAVAICPGPNLAYFSGIHTLQDMVDHIYGRKNLLNKVYRPHVFNNELLIYVDYLNKMIQDEPSPIDKKRVNYLTTFKTNLLKGISYYEEKCEQFETHVEQFKKDLEELKIKLQNILIPEEGVFSLSN